MRRYALFVPLVLAIAVVAGISWLKVARAQTSVGVSMPPAIEPDSGPGFFYYGSDGHRTRLAPAPQKLGITFKTRPAPGGLTASLRDEPLLEPVGDAESPGEALRAPTRIVRVTRALAAQDLDGLVERVRARAEVESVNRVFVLPSGHETLLTDLLYVSVAASLYDTDVGPRFARDGLEVIARVPYPELGRVGYRLRVPKATRDATGEDALAVANRYHAEPWVREAAPTFAPLYRIITSPSEPNDPLYGDSSSQDWQWYLDLIHAPEAWEAVYAIYTGKYHWDTTQFCPAEVPRIVIAGLDNGVTVDYQDRGASDPGPGGNGGYYQFAAPDNTYILYGHPDFYLPQRPQPPDVLPESESNQWINKFEDAATAQVGVDDDNNGYVDDHFGWDFVGTDPFDELGGDRIPFPDFVPAPPFLNTNRRHGNHTISVATARGDNGRGMAGLCWNAEVMPLRFHNNTFTIREYDWTDVYCLWRAADAYNYAVNQGAQVLCVMLACETYDPGLHDAVQNARRCGVVLASGTGITHESVDSAPQYPACWPEGFAVGASSAWYEDGTFTHEELWWNEPHSPASLGTSYGYALDFLAPVYLDTDGVVGEEDLSWDGVYDFGYEHYVQGFDWLAHDYSQQPPVEAELYGEGSGPSNAVPQVSGLAALLFTVNPAFSPAEIQAIMAWTAEDLGEAGRDYYTGWGRIDAERAVNLALKPRFSIRRSVTVGAGQASAFVRHINALSIDQEGNLVVDGRIVESALIGDPTSLTPVAGVSEWIVRQGTTVMARFDPRWDGTHVPTLYLRGNLSWRDGPAGHHSDPDEDTGLTHPQGQAFVLQHANGQDQYIQAYIDADGNLVLAGRVFIGADPDPVGTKTAGPTGSGANYVGETAIQDAIDDVPEHTIIEVYQGTYAPINFNNKDVVVRSVHPTDIWAMAATVIDAALTPQDDPAVQFGGAETEDCALIGFTITGGIATNGGGFYSGTTAQGKRSWARILYNHIYDNHATGEGGGIAYCDGLIEGNIIGPYFEGDLGNSANSGGGIAGYEQSTIGIIRKNLVVGNSAGASGGGLFKCNGTIEINYIACNTAPNGGGVDSSGNATMGKGIRSNLVYANTATYEGGGLYECSGLILNNTVYGNTAAAGEGGGLQSCYSATIRNNIVWANQDQQIVSCSSPTYCCIQDWQGGGTGNINDDPRFVSTDPALGFYLFLHLNDDSPCIDRGYPVIPNPQVLGRDFDDQLTPVDIENVGNEYSSNKWPDDIGADEYPTQDPGQLVYWWERFAAPEDCFWE